MTLLLVVLLWLEPMPWGIPFPPSPIHTSHIPPANPNLDRAGKCLVGKSESKNGLLTIRLWEKCK